MGVFANVYQDGDHADVGDVLLGVTYANGDLVGTFDDDAHLPAESDVRLGTIFDDGDKTGSLAVPSVNQVLLGVSVDASVGNVRLPDVANVELAVAYGSLDSLIGVLTVPAETDVREGKTYGASLVLTGTYDVPGQDNVQLGFTWDNAAMVGTVRLPTQVQVELGVVYGPNDILVGSLDPGVSGDLPAAQDVRDGVQYDNGGSTGNLVVPLVTNVREGILYDSPAVPQIGTLNIDAEAHPPGEGFVRLGITYGSTNQLTGNSVLPAENQVLVGVGYGSSGTEFTGTLDAGSGPGDPAESDVRQGVIYGNSGEKTGNVHVPPAGVVKWGYQYDTLDSVTGTLVTTEGTPFIEFDLQIIRGDSYEGDDISWVDDGRWPDIGGATVKVGFVGGATTIEYPAVVSGANPQEVSLPLTKEETAALRSGYVYDVQATLTGGEVKTLASGRVWASDTQTDIPVDTPIPPGSPA